MTPCAITSQPPRIHIHSFAGTEAGCHPVPDPACGDGNTTAAGASICIPAMEASCSCATRDVTDITIRNSVPANFFSTTTSIQIFCAAFLHPAQIANHKGRRTRSLPKASLEHALRDASCPSWFTDFLDSQRREVRWTAGGEDGCCSFEMERGIQRKLRISPNIRDLRKHWPDSNRRTRNRPLMTVHAALITGGYRR